MKEYACYKDDEFITIGTLKEIAKYLGITYDSLRTIKSKKIIYTFILLGDD
jgi:hypothetical protein